MRHPKEKELKDLDYNRIETLSEEGNGLYGQEKYRPALRKYEEALQIVPEPKSDWEASTWLYTSIGDAFFSLGEVDKAKENYYNAMNCPDGITSAYVQLVLGQALFELGENKKGEQALFRAYLSEGYEIFEDEDPKYRKSIQHLIDEDQEDKDIDSKRPEREYIYENFTRYYPDDDGNLIEDN